MSELLEQSLDSLKDLLQIRKGLMSADDPEWLKRDIKRLIRILYKKWMKEFRREMRRQKKNMRKKVLGNKYGPPDKINN